MQEQPLVSILMTSYNREKFIGEAIESVLASTYRNLELIIVDDRSSDGTLAIARKYEALDSRVRVYLNEVNLGDYPNRNKAAGYAKGKYIKYIDADDAIYYWGLQVVVEMMERFPEAAFGFDSILQDDERMFPYVMNPREAYEGHYIRRMGLFGKAPTSCIVKTDVFLAEGGFRPFRMVGDFEMWHRLAAKYPLLIMPDGMVWSRGHGDSESGKMFPIPAINYHYTYVSRQYLASEDCPLTLEMKNPLVSAVAMTQVKLLLKLLISFRFHDISEIRKIDSVSVFDLVRTAFFGVSRK